jgi:hypothetical protein
VYADLHIETFSVDFMSVSVDKGHLGDAIAGVGMMTPIAMMEAKISFFMVI